MANVPALASNNIPKHAILCEGSSIILALSGNPKNASS